MERLQFIVRELNKLLGTSYNLLSFDALGPANLLGVIGDVFHALGAGPKVSHQIIYVLKNIHINPPLDTKSRHIRSYDYHTISLAID